MIESGYIYGLRLQGSSEYRYVGLTTGSPETRLGRHIVDASRTNRKRRPVHDWINKYTSDIVVDKLETVYNREDLGNAERRWISDLRESGHRLLNLSLGGDSGSYGARWTLREDQRRIGEKHPFYGKVHSEEAKASISRKKKGVPSTSAHKRYHVNKGVSKPDTCKYCKEESRVI